MTNSARAEAAGFLHDLPRARIVFQPIVELGALRVIGVEALARFADGTPPPAILEKAEAAGFRPELEIELIAAALRAADDLPSGLAVTYNASGVTILRPELAALLGGTDRPWGLEIYEGATTADLREVRATVTRLGGRLLVDDAGASRADATRITTLRPDIVKIDRALFWEVAEDATAQERLEVLLRAAREAGARTLVEGVSDAAQLDRARELGADYAQGYHLGMPTPADDIPALFDELRRSVGVDAAGL